MSGCTEGGNFKSRECRFALVANPNRVIKVLVHRTFFVGVWPVPHGATILVDLLNARSSFRVSEQPRLGHANARPMTMTAMIAVLVAAMLLAALVANRKRTAPSTEPPLHPSLPRV
jgi:hypothetical protein